MKRSSKQLSLEWTKGLNEEDKKSMEEVVRHSTILLTQLHRIIDDKLEVLERKEVDPSTYDAGYPYYQAHINGKRASLEELRRLLDFMD